MAEQKKHEQAQLGQKLVENKVITQEQLAKGLNEQENCMRARRGYNKAWICYRIRYTSCNCKAIKYSLRKN